MFDGLALVGRHAGRGVALDMLDRAEAFAASAMARSLVVTSFWKSTNALPCWSPGGGDRGADTRHASRDCRTLALRRRRRRSLPPGMRPDRMCRCRRRPSAPARPIRPAGMPADARRTAACRATAKTDAPTASSRRTSAPVSQAMASPLDRIARSTRRRPLVATTLVADAHRQAGRARRVADLRCAGRRRRDGDAGFAQRERRRIGAVVRWWRSPRACRPSRRSAADRSRAASASMMPGRSLPGNTSGRSIAPVAITTLPRPHLPQPLARQIAGRGRAR